MHGWIWVVLFLFGQSACVSGKASFLVDNDRFVLDGQPFQIISGSIHYFRVPRAYWEDRLLRLKALGLNTVQIYIPWNKHEPQPGSYDWAENLAVTEFVELADKLGLWVILRAGPYICAEWDGGGIPWWLASSKVRGGGALKLRSEDPLYLKHVEQWWNVVLPKLAPYARSRQGPILMVQVENEYGFCGSSESYIQSLISIAKSSFGNEMLIFTTDPPSIIKRGSIAGKAVFSVVDFGPQMDAASAFAVQKSMNPPGKSAPFCSEYYTGWLTHWGQAMTNNSAQQMVDSFTRILQYGNNTGSVNLYMAHGGTNFGFYAGAGLSGTDFLPQITSYDYTAPLSEQGRTGQPGTGGPNKYKMLRAAIASHTGIIEAEWPQNIPTAMYGTVNMTEAVPLLTAVARLFPGDGIPSEQPKNMEEYDQGYGAILYTTHVPDKLLDNGGTLDLGGPVHDYAHVFFEDRLVGQLDRGHPKPLNIASSKGKAKGNELKILVHAMGRDSGGCSFDIKGLVNPVTINGEPLQSWRTFLLPLNNLELLEPDLRAAGNSNLEEDMMQLQSVPTILRGTFEINDTVEVAATGHLPDTFLDLSAWGKGVAFVNGFNLGWYWPSIGPQNHYFVPGPRLRKGRNEVLLLELERLPAKLTVDLVEEADLTGPRNRPGLGNTYDLQSRDTASIADQYRMHAVLAVS